MIRFLDFAPDFHELDRPAAENANFRRYSSFSIAKVWTWRADTLRTVDWRSGPGSRWGPTGNQHVTPT